MTGPQIFALAIVVAAGLILIKLARRGRYHCGTCGDRFDTEAGLAGHVDDVHGRCQAAGPGKHTCALPRFHEADVHVCGCGLPFDQEDQQ